MLISEDHIIHAKYVIFTFGSCTSLFLAIMVTKKWKPLLYGLFIISTFFLLRFARLQDKIYASDQLRHVGSYYLSNYPSSDSCYIELSQDMTYKFFKKGYQVKSGTWHNETGSNYNTTYLDNDKYQLGEGKFTYKYFVRYHKPVINNE